MHEEKVIDRLENPPVIKNTKQIDLGDMPEDMDVELAKVAIFEIVEETLSKFHDSNLESKAARHNIANEIFKHIINEGFVYKVTDKEFGGDTGIDADYEQAIADIEADNMMSDYTYEQDQINELENQKEHTKKANKISIKDVNKEISKDMRVLASTRRAIPSPVPGGTTDEKGEKDGKSRSSNKNKNN